MFSACLLAFFTGFISLSQEILWVRLFSFTNHSLPQAFAFVLMMYLLGIAIGAQIGRKFCNPSFNLWIVSGVVLMVSGFYDLASPWIYAEWAQTPWQIAYGGFLILLTALFKSIVFPIAHHLGTPEWESHVGKRVSRVYVSNILGATLGPIITGLLFLDIFTTQQCYAIFAGMAIIVGFYCLVGCVQQRILAAGVLVTIAILAAVWMRPSSLLISEVVKGKKAIRQIVENSHGIVTIYRGSHDDDIVFGGNVYDGRTNLDLVRNSNNLNRLIILSALQDNPERVLMIGLSIGSWLKIMTSFPGVKQIDVVEINPGYLEAIKNYPQQYGALKDPRVKLYIDDGRRWLKNHPNAQYDLVVMNTTYYWRAYASNLLSKEFLTLVKNHMKPHAVLEFNTTKSPDALETATNVFSNAYLYENLAVAADYDWRLKLHDPAALKKLSALSLDGKLLFPPGSEYIIRAYLNEPIVSAENLQNISSNTLGRDLEVITDRNLITEFKYGCSLFHKE